jgi:hypothetical protein
MSTRWKLKVQRGLRTGYFVAQASDEEGAVAAVRKKRGMKHAEITIVRDQPRDEPDWPTLKDNEALRVSGL